MLNKHPSVAVLLKNKGWKIEWLDERIYKPIVDEILDICNKYSKDNKNVVKEECNKFVFDKSTINTIDKALFALGEDFHDNEKQKILIIEKDSIQRKGRDN
jgi:hypothetical protein